MSGHMVLVGEGVASEPRHGKGSKPCTAAPSPAEEFECVTWTPPAIASTHDGAIRDAIVNAVCSGEFTTADVWQVVEDAVEEAKQVGHRVPGTTRTV